MVIVLEPGSPSTVRCATVAPIIVAASRAEANQVVRGIRKRKPPPISTTPVKHRKPEVVKGDYLAMIGW